MTELHKIRDLISKLESLGNDYPSVSKILLFGSQARQLTNTSDVDVLIVLSTEVQKLDLLKTLCHLTLEYRILIHPVIYTINEFGLRKSISIYRDNILAEAQLLFQRNSICE